MLLKLSILTDTLKSRQFCQLIAFKRKGVKRGQNRFTQNPCLKLNNKNINIGESFFYSYML